MDKKNPAMMEVLQTVMRLLGIKMASVERAVSLPNIYQMVYAQLDNLYEQDGIMRSLIDVYLDGNSMYAVVGMNGLLYKTVLTMGSGGVGLGEMQAVEVDYKPVEQQKRGLRVLRQADGKYRWFAFPAATAVLNRSGELDTRALYQSFIEKIHSGEADYPFLSFYHVGERITLGQADYVALDGYAYLISGTFNEDALSQAARKAVEADPEYYGLSIGFYFDPVKGREKLEVAEGISIPTYNDGYNHEVSILAERDAACLFTGIYIQKEGVNRMNEKTKEELRKLVGDDPEAQAMAEELMLKVDSVNARIEADNLIRRDNAEATETTTEPTTPAEPPAPAAELVMDDDTMTALASRVAENLHGIFDERIEALRSEANATIEELRSTVSALEARIAGLEQTDENKVKQAVKDMPRLTGRITYRPRTVEANQPEPKEPGSLEEIAKATVSILK
jgi:hypothetical protein